MGEPFTTCQYPVLHRPGAARQLPSGRRLQGLVNPRIETGAPGDYTYYLLISGCPVPVYRVCTTFISSSPQTTKLTYAVQAECSGYNVVQTGLLISNLGCSFNIHPPAFILFPAYHNVMLLPSPPVY